jgi:hypothetical protein
MDILLRLDLGQKKFAPLSLARRKKAGSCKFTSCVLFVLRSARAQSAAALFMN